MLYGQPRFYKEGTRIYVIRDVWTGKPRPGSPLANGSLVRCEYGRLRLSGRLRWAPCAEGLTSFKTIRPMGRVRYGAS